MTVLLKEIKSALAFRRLGHALAFVWDCSRAWTVANIAVIIVQGILPVVSLYIMKMVIDAITAAITEPETGHDFSKIIFLIALEGVVAFMTAISGVAARWVGDIHAEMVTTYMHNVTLSQSYNVDLEYYETAEYYDTQHRAQSEATFRPKKILNDLLSFAQNLISFAGMAALLLYLHWAIFLLLFLASIPGIIARSTSSGLLYQWRRERTPEERKAWYFHWMLCGDAMAKEIRLYNLGSRFLGIYQSLRSRLLTERREIAAKRAVVESITHIGTTTAVFGSYAFIAYRTFQGTITVGDLLLYYQAFQRGQEFLRNTLGNFNALYEDARYFSDLLDFLDLRPRITAPLQPMVIPDPIQHGIVFDRVTFKYPGSNRVAVQNISFSISAGEVVAFVGENGSGKTTLIKLLTRLYDPMSGGISIDGTDLRHFDPDKLRAQIGVTFQDFARYNLTVKDNICFGDILKSADMDAIKKVATDSKADAVISTLRKGYDTVLGKWFEDGEELSYGEWQKLALARAYFRDAQVIVLDEPTSAMDVKTEYQILLELKRRFSGKTVILITHHLSAARIADSIYVLKGGAVVEQGNHARLMSLGGAYAEMFRMQASGFF